MVDVMRSDPASTIPVVDDEPPVVPPEEPPVVGPSDASPVVPEVAPVLDDTEPVAPPSRWPPSEPPVDEVDVLPVPPSGDDVSPLLCASPPPSFVPPEPSPDRASPPYVAAASPVVPEPPVVVPGLSLRERSSTEHAAPRATRRKHPPTATSDREGRSEKRSENTTRTISL
jgi:hypothetical protein